MSRGLAGGKAVSLIGALCGGGRGKVQHVGCFFFPPCLFPAGWGGVEGGCGLDGRVIPLAVARLLLLCVGAAAICPADAD